MSSFQPAIPNINLNEVETPALLLDMDIFEKNLITMENALAGSGVRLRAHTKAHKCSEIAKRQISAGAVGVCCQKVSEAVTMAAAGIKNILITNQIVDPVKLQRLCSIGGKAEIAVLCDSKETIPLLSEAATFNRITLKILIEVNVGANRCGVDAGDPVALLASEIEKAPSLSFAGLQAYHGSAQHLVSASDRQTKISSTIAEVKRSKASLAAAGLDRKWVTGAGTGTFTFERDSGIYTEVQAGSYAFMDGDYAKIKGDDGNPFTIFSHSLFLWSSVISNPRSGQAFLDIGHKGHSMDSGLATVSDLDGIEVTGQSDEHTALEVGHNAKALNIGQKLKLIPGHVDPTFNLHDWVVCIRKNKVEDIWPIDARGPGF